MEQTLLPTLYSCLRSKTCCLETVIETIVTVLSRDCNPSVINSYASKISVELSKSSRSFERESALLFFYHASQNFSTVYRGIEESTSTLSPSQTKKSQ